jgi:hypothetical protein
VASWKRSHRWVGFEPDLSSGAFFLAEQYDNISELGRETVRGAPGNILEGHQDYRCMHGPAWRASCAPKPSSMESSMYAVTTAGIGYTSSWQHLHRLRNRQASRNLRDTDEFVK